MSDLLSKQKGSITELECIASFYKLGYQCSIPYGENSRYDFIADIKGKLIRIQSKTSKEIKNQAIEFSCRSCRSNSKNAVHRRYTEKEIDYFCTYWNGKCYLVPVTECADKKTLRFKNTKNNQKVKISYAKDYEIEKQIEKIINREVKP